MPMVNFRSARPREPPVAKRKCRIILRNSRSRSSSHSENDAEYIMGLRRSGASRDYDIVDMRFSTSTTAMADALQRMRERRRGSCSEAVADKEVVESDVAIMEDGQADDRKDLADGMLGAMHIKKEDDDQLIGAVASPSAVYSPFSPLASITETPEAIEEAEMDTKSEGGDLYTTIEVQMGSWNDSTFPSFTDILGDPYATSPGRSLNDMMTEESKAWNGTLPSQQTTLTPVRIAPFAHERRLLQVALDRNQSGYEHNVHVLKNEKPSTLPQSVAPHQVLTEPNCAPVYLGTLLEENFHHGKPMDITNMVSFPAFLPAPIIPKEIEYKFGTDPQFSMVPGTFVMDPKFSQSPSGPIPTTWALSSVTEDAEFKSMETQFMDLFFDGPKNLMGNNMWSEAQSSISFFAPGQANKSNSAPGQAAHG